MNSKWRYLEVEVNLVSGMQRLMVGVGKSSLTGQFVSRMWTERYDPTIEDAFRKEIKVNGEKCVLEMCCIFSRDH